MLFLHAGRTTAQRFYSDRDLARMKRGVDAIALNVTSPTLLGSPARDAADEATALDPELLEVDDESCEFYDDDTFDGVATASPTVWPWGSCPKELPLGADHRTWAAAAVEALLKGLPSLSQPWDLNPRPAVYETAALPLS